MKTCAWTLAALVTSVAFADKLVVDYDEYGGVDVAENETVSQAESVVLCDGAKFVKAGKGTYELPLAKVDAVAHYELEVREGTVKVSDGEPVVLAATPPACVNDKAAFWVDAAANNGSLVLNGDKVTKWCDCRETNTESPTRIWAYPKSTSTADGEDIDQVYVNATGTNAVYFGGYNTKNRRYMQFATPGNNNFRLCGVYHAFVVHGPFECYSAPLGSGSNPNEWFSSATIKSMLSPPLFIDIRYAEVMPGGVTARHYLDGARFDPFVTRVQPGFQLWETEYLWMTGTHGNFFNQKGAASRQGGDYLSEVILFTNRLTSAERLDVQRYLMKKWNLKSHFETYERPARVQLAASANALFDVASGEAARLNGAALAGNGALTKTGAGTLEIDRGFADEFDGEVDLQAGDLILRRATPPALKVAPGDTVEAKWLTDGATMDNEGVKYENYRMQVKRTNVAGDKNVTLTGTVPKRLTSVPDGVKKLRLTAGDLTLAAAPGEKLVDGGALYATIPNADFEQAYEADSTYNRHTAGNSAGFNGWCGNGQLIAENYSPADVGSNSPHSRGTICPFPIRQGAQAMTIGNNGHVYAKNAVFPKSGYYEMTVLESNRHLVNDAPTGPGSYNQLRCPSYEVKIGSDWAHAVTVAERKSANHGPFSRVKVSLGYVEAGTYVFGFQNGPSDSGGATLILDDIKVRFVGEKGYETVVKVPNGDFEDVTNRTIQAFIDSFTGTYPTFNRNFYPRRTNANEAVGWTFANDDTANPAVSVVSPNCEWLYYNKVWPTTANVNENKTWLMLCDLADGLYGSFHLFLKGNAGSVTSKSFTVPAGTYQLRGKAALWGCACDGVEYRSNPVVEATLGTTSLGSLTIGQHVMNALYWPTTVTFAEPTDVTLTLRQTAAAGACLVDEFELVRTDTIGDYDVELVTNGSFEVEGREADGGASTTGWTTFSATFGSGNVSSTNPTWDLEHNPGNQVPTQFGPTPYKGVAYGRLVNNARCSTASPLALNAGLYRFTFATHSRSNAGYNKQPLQAYLVETGTANTNFIGRTKVETSGDLEHIWYVRVLKDGNYTLSIAGDETWKAQFASDGCNHTSLFDGVSLKRVRDTTAQPSISETTKIEIAEGSTLRLDFDGTVATGSVTYNGVRYLGEISAATHPEFVQGRGVLNATPSNVGMTILIR